MTIDPGTKKALIISGIVFLVSVGLYGALRMETSALKKSAIELKTSLGEAHVTSFGKQASGSVLRQIESEQQVIKSYYLSEDDISDFISFLEDEGRAVGVTPQIDSVEEQGEGEKDIVIRISIDGSWNGVLHYTSLLEHMPFELEIESASFSRNIEEGSWKATYSLRSPLVNESL